MTATSRKLQSLPPRKHTQFPRLQPPRLTQLAGTMRISIAHITSKMQEHDRAQMQLKLEIMQECSDHKQKISTRQTYITARRDYIFANTASTVARLYHTHFRPQHSSMHFISKPPVASNFISQPPVVSAEQFASQDFKSAGTSTQQQSYITQSCSRTLHLRS